MFLLAYDKEYRLESEFNHRPLSPSLIPLAMSLLREMGL